MDIVMQLSRQDEVSVEVGEGVLMLLVAWNIPWGHFQTLPGPRSCPTFALCGPRWPTVQVCFYASFLRWGTVSPPTPRV